MKTACTTVFVCAFSMMVAQAQSLSPAKLGFDAYALEDAQLGKINYYLSKGPDTTARPLLVYLDGSGPYPLFQYSEGGYLGSTVVLDFQSLKEQWRILMIGKPGVPFLDTVGSDERGFPEYPAPQWYREKLSLDWRVDAAEQVLQFVAEVPGIDTSAVVVFGFSEGAQVAPFVARRCPQVTHLLLFGCNGLNQFFDPVIQARMKAARGIHSEAQAQAEIDSLWRVYAEIYRQPERTDTSWWGHTYLRWSSFTREDPLDALQQLEIPIYIANGSLDENSVLSADYIQLDFLRRGKSNLTYKTYPGYDHQFNHQVFQHGQLKEVVPRLTEVLQEAMEWLDEKMPTH